VVSPSRDQRSVVSSSRSPLFNLRSPISHLRSPIFYLLPLAGYWLILIYQLGAQWSVYEQYHYGWAVPFLCAYLLWRRVTQASQSPSPASPPAAADTPSPGGALSSQRSVVSSQWSVVRSPSSLSHLPSSIFLLLLAACAFLYLPTRFLHEANPIWRLTSLLWTLEVIAITLLFLWSSSLVISSPVVSLSSSPVVPPSRSPVVSSPCSPVVSLSVVPWSVVSWSRSLVFPVCFFLVAVPWPSGLENLLTQSLMRLNASTAVELLGLFWIPAVQHGNVIEVSAGAVGIDEACSGIRSLQATLMISLFLGELYALSASRRALCVVAGFALAFAFNLGRTLLLTRVAAAKGIGAVAAWHDPAGITILVACFLALWLIARALQKPDISRSWSIVSSPWSVVSRPVVRSPIVRSPVVSNPVVSSHVVRDPVVSSPVVSSPRSPVVPLSVVSWSLFAWLLLVETGTELWYRSHEQVTAGSVEWSVHRPDQSSAYTEVEIPTGISGQLRYDEGTQRRWLDGSGNSWVLYYFRWFPAHSLQKRVAIQLAKTHGPETCLPVVGIKESARLGIITVPVAGMEVAMQHYVFNADGNSLQVFHGIYEDPAGSSTLANRRKDFRSRIAAALAGSRNYGQRFFEVAVVGYERPEEAKAALAGELEKLITVGRVTRGPRDN
jgi:exosortase